MKEMPINRYPPRMEIARTRPSLFEFSYPKPNLGFDFFQVLKGKKRAKTVPPE